MASVLSRGQGTISTLAGGGINFPGDGGPATSANLQSPNAVAVDSAGNVYFVEAMNYRVRKVNPAGIISTFAGTGVPGFGAVGDGGPATSAQFIFGGIHEGIAVDGVGNVYITDSHNFRVRKVDANGNITTFAGSGLPGSSGDGGPANKAGMTSPSSLAVDSAGNVYIGDLLSSRVRKVDTSGIITTVAGNGTPGNSGDGGPATSAQFYAPSAIALDNAGNLYVADGTSQLIRKVDTNGIIHTVAGNGTAGFTGDGGPATSAEFFGIEGLATDSAGNLYICDYDNKRVRKVDTSGKVTTVVGTGTFGNSGDGGVSTSATLTGPLDVFVDSSGNLYIADGPGGRIRKVTSGSSGGPGPPVTNLINTVAGGGTGGDGSPATSASLAYPQGVAVGPAGNIYIADPLVGVIRKVNAAGIISTFAGNGTYGFSGDGGPATSAALTSGNVHHQGLAADGAGNVYIADIGNQRIRKVNPAGIISTVAGSGDGSADYPGDGGLATKAAISYSPGVAVDSAGNLYIATGSDRIVKVNSAGIITTVAGTGMQGSGGDGGPATKATINAPSAIAFDAAGNMYIAESQGLRIRKVNTSGIISTLAGNGTPGFSGDGGPAVNAQFATIDGIAADSSGNVYITDRNNNRVRKVDPSGTINTFAGTGTFGFTGDGGAAASATVSTPGDVAVDSSGNLYIADSGNVRIRKIAVAPGAPAITLVANAYGDTPTIAPNMWVEIKGSNLAPSGDSRIWQGPDFVNNRLPTQLDGVSVTVNGRSAFVYFISATQVNILTPPDALSGSVQVQLTLNGVQSNSVSVPTQLVAPSFFTFDGKNIVGTHLDGSLLGPASLYPGFSTPAKPGETVIVYGNGFGSTSTQVVSGALTQSGSLPVLPVLAMGGTPAVVLAANLISPGLFQFNITVPAADADGNAVVSAIYGGSTTQKGVVLAVQH
jgi:uncharacterized protein (TIGR03437 family)